MRAAARGRLVTAPPDPATRERLDERAGAWRVALEEVLETETSLVAYGRRGGEAVVIKVVKREGDEWHSGEVVEAFEGRGVVRLHEFVPGALLLERLYPGTPLRDLAVSGRDDEATAILTQVIGSMSPRRPPAASATVEQWGEAFDRYGARGNSPLPAHLVERGRAVYAALAATQGSVRLLHGDLQHYNVLLDRTRGWVAIDPKGVVGEVAYEAGALLRNPRERPDLLARPRTIERRVHTLASTLGLDAERVLGWGFAQAVLSAIWSIEDGSTLDARDPALLLAEVMWPMVGAGG